MSEEQQPMVTIRRSLPGATPEDRYDYAVVSDNLKTGEYPYDAMKRLDDEISRFREDLLEKPVETPRERPTDAAQAQSSENEGSKPTSDGNVVIEGTVVKKHPLKKTKAGDPMQRFTLKPDGGGGNIAFNLLYEAAQAAALDINEGDKMTIEGPPAEEKSWEKSPTQTIKFLEMFPVKVLSPDLESDIPI